MLYFVLARAGGGKTTHIHNLIAEFVQAGNRDLCVCVPEQFSFATERCMLERLGAAGADAVQVLSFSRLAQTALHTSGQLDDAARVACMRFALDSVKDHLQIFGTQVHKSSVVRQMLSLTDELRQGNVTAAQLTETAQTIENELLRQKLRDLALILDAYTSLLAQRGMDEQALLTRFATFLKTTDYFANRLVFIDSFHGFTQQELDVLQQILRQAKAVYVTLCTDTLEQAFGYSDIFYHPKRTAAQLMRLARENGVPIAKPQYLSAFSKFNNFPPKFRRYASDALAALEAGLFEPGADVYEAACDDITVCAAEDIRQECAWIAAEAKRLIREKGLRCRDIAVIAWNAETYEAPLRAQLRQSGLPVFEDTRKPILEQPLFRFVLCAAEIAAQGFATDTVLRYLKTGLSAFDVPQIALLENYAYTWDISGGRWLQEWTMHPDGFGQTIDDDARQALAEINALREKLVFPLLHLRDALHDTTAAGFAKALYTFLLETQTPQQLQQFAAELASGGDAQAAQEQNRVWELLVALLDTIHDTLGEQPMSAVQLCELFGLMASTQTMGVLPQGLDEITIGSADRIRTLGPKVVFVAGVNDGVFPPAATSAGMLSERERKVLQDSGLGLAVSGVEKIAQERFFAYNALCSAREKLFVSYVQKDEQGQPLVAGELVTRIRTLLPGCRSVSTLDCDPLDLVESRASAFTQLAQSYPTGNALYASLRTVLQEDDAYRHRLQAMERFVQNDVFAIADSQIARELFSTKMQLSATKVDRYYQCAFSYFCEYGMRARPRKKAAFDPLQRGSLLHAVLELMLRRYTVQALGEMSAQQRLALVREEVTSYREAILQTGVTSAQADALFERNVNTIDMILQRLLDELAQSSFQPVDLELEIHSGKDIEPYSLTLDNGATLQMIGKVDRVDMATLNGQRYIKIVDYKSSNKAFALSDVLAGLNMQMLIYLFAIMRGGKQRYGEALPAGILYQPLQIKTKESVRGTDEATLRNNVVRENRAQGLLLNNTEVVLAMDREGAGLYVPAKLKKEQLTGNVLALEQLAALNTRVDALLCDMAEQLLRGNIPAYPVYGKPRYEHTCDYCYYRDVCLREADAPMRELAPMEFLPAAQTLGAAPQDEGIATTGRDPHAGN